MNPEDHTHLNVHGSVVFGRMISDLMVKQFGDIRAVTEGNGTLSREIWGGVAA